MTIVMVVIVRSHGALFRVLGLGGLDRIPIRGIRLTAIPYGGIRQDMHKAGHQTAKSARLKRLSRIEGQVRGLARMVDEDRYCIDIITQIAAVRAALRRVEEEILRDHIGHCVEHAIVSGDADEQRQKIAELMDVLGRANR
jgi:CsoR family transcriptional regulator, copper-sensing transcriptional repressor